jgi:cytochrome c biogenesis protein CcdA
MESLGYLVTVTGLMNGLNPCALGLMITFLGYLMVFGGKKKKDKNILILGGLYLFGVVITYLLLGLVFYQLAYGLQRSVWVGLVKYVLAFLLFVFGLMQINEGLWPDSKFKIKTPKNLNVWFGRLMKKINGPVAILVGGLTAVISAPCTLPVYAGTAMVLARSGMVSVKILGYFVYYNLLFVLPLLTVLILVYKGREVVDMKEFGHRSEKFLRVVGGVLLLLLGWWMIE